MHLVISAYGSSVTRDNSLFRVSNAEGTQHFNPEDIRSITVSRGATISSDAVILAIEHGIDVIFVNALGEPLGRIWSVRYGSFSEIRQKQIEFLYSSHVVTWVKELISCKITNQMALLSGYLEGENTDRIHNILRGAIRAMKDHLQKIQKAEGDSLHDLASSLRGWEGAAAKRYFAAVSELLPQAYRFEKRTTHPSLDPFNAALNYGYGMLYSKVEGALIKAGLDPYCGIYHRDQYNRPALVFDVIERFRIWIDFVIITLFRHETFTEDCFRYENHICLLDGLGKRIVIQSINDYLDEIIRMDNMERSRAVHLNLYAQRLAKYFLHYDQKN